MSKHFSLLLTSLFPLVPLFILYIVHDLLHPLNKVPGPRTFALTKWRLAWEDYHGRRTRTIHKLHKQYGPVVRIGPNEVHFNTLSAQRAIYGPGSGFGRTHFYRMFDVYGQQNLFTFHGTKEHAERKKLLAHVYSKSYIVKGHTADMIARKVNDFLAWIEAKKHQIARDGVTKVADEIFTSLHYYSLDSITEFLYGQAGATEALRGNVEHQMLIGDILDPSRRRLSWFAVHLPKLTKWLYSREGFTGKIVSPFLPMKKPATYSGIRTYALAAIEEYRQVRKSDGEDRRAITGLLYQSIDSGRAKLNDLQIASEVADHFLAGIDTTSDTLMFLIWALSLPHNKIYQETLIEEVEAIPESFIDPHGLPTVASLDGLKYLDAVVKETLRLYAPLPASEPRSSPTETIIDGYKLPAGTVVCMAPYSLHRNEDVFPDPMKWDPERWLRSSNHLTEMNKWWWAFSSGARMCIGMHLALAEMAIIPAIYRKYRTSVKQDCEHFAPGVTSRFEVFGDDNFTETQEHVCWIQFHEK